MIFWECWQRVASELNPSGYVYKQFPEDFQDTYIPVQNDKGPEIKMIPLQFSLALRREVPVWSRDLIARSRIPQPDFDPDDWQAINTRWRGKQAYQTVALKPSSTSWQNDKSVEGNSGFRFLSTSC